MTLPSERTIEKEDGNTITMRVSGNWKRPVIGVRRAAWRDWRITYNSKDITLGSRMKSERMAENWATYMRVQVEAQHQESIMRCRLWGLEPPAEAFE